MPVPWPSFARALHIFAMFVQSLLIIIISVPLGGVLHNHFITLITPLPLDLSDALPHLTVPYHTIFKPYNSVSYPTISCHTLPFHTMPTIPFSYHTLPHHTIPSHTILLVDLSDALALPDFLAFIQSGADLFQARPSNHDDHHDLHHQ